MAEAMLDCAVCGTRKWKPMEGSHAEDLRIAGAAKLFCESCTRETYWLYSQHEEGSAAPRRTAEPPARVDPTALPADVPGAAAVLADASGGSQGPVRSMQTERRLGSDRRQRARRNQRRVSLQVPVRLRVSSPSAQFEEVTRTVNVCRSGIYIQTERPYSKGLPLYVAMNYSLRDPGMAGEQKATVVRVDAVPGSPAKGVAIQLH